MRPPSAAAFSCRPRAAPKPVSIVWSTGAIGDPFFVLGPTGSGFFPIRLASADDRTRKQALLEHDVQLCSQKRHNDRRIEPPEDRDHDRKVAVGRLSMLETIRYDHRRDLLEDDKHASPRGLRLGARLREHAEAAHDLLE